MMRNEQRWGKLAAVVDSLPQTERQEALKALDRILQPVAGRELEDALKRSGFSRGEARRALAALAEFHILKGASDGQAG